MSIILRFIGFITPQLFAGLMGFWMVIIGLVLFGMTRTGYRIYREIGMRLPFIGTFMKKINLARFCRIFGLQYAAGVPLLEGLEASRQVLQDSNIERAVRGIEKRVQGGMELREAMVSVGVFPKQMVGMVGVGERAGGVDRMLEKLAEYYELDIRTTATIMTTVIWFVVFLMVGVTVGAIVISAWGHYFGMIGELIDEA
jgi:type II secretory pathway component PulF